MKNRQGLTIAALIVAIIGLSIGFAAFSNTLNISSTASVNPDASSLKVVFANNTDVNNLNIDPVQVYSASTGSSGTPGTINNEAQNGPTLTGLKASFTEPGQSVVYKLNVVNAGKLKAYLTDIVFGTTGNPAKAVSCTAATKDSNNQDIPAAEQATDSLVQSACNGISISVKIGELEAKTSSGSLNNLELNVGAYKEVVITISYASGSAYVDGPMNVAFGDIEINASSTSSTNGQQGGGQETPVTPTYSIGDTYTGDYISTQQNVLTNYIGSSRSIVIPEKLPIVEARSTYNATKCNEVASQGVPEGFCAEVEKYLNGQTYDSNILNPSIKSYIDSNPSIVSDTIYVVSDAIEYDITSMATGVFLEKRLIDVSFNSKLTSISQAAFNNNDLTILDIPSNIISIGNVAFNNNNLTSVRIHNNQENVTLYTDAFPDGTEIQFDNATINYH